MVDATKEVRTLARLDGKPAVVLQVQRQSGENTVEVIDAVEKTVAALANCCRRTSQVTVIQDQSRYILAALHEIQSHLISGSILAAITVLLFMRSWRSTLIAAVAIPTSIIATFAVMKLFGFTLNNVTMLALVLMVGVVIDDAIVVLENVFHCIEEKGMDPVAGGDRRHARNRPGRAGDHDLAGDRVSAGVVSVERHRADAVRVRHDGDRGDPDLDAGQLLAHADDVQQAAAEGTTAESGNGGPPRGAGSTTGSKSATCACLRLSMRFRWAGLLLSIARRSPPTGRSTTW